MTSVNIDLNEPLAIRIGLGVGPVDLVAWEVTADGSPCVRRVQPPDLDYLRAVEGTLSEWAGAADEAAYHADEFVTAWGLRDPTTSGARLLGSQAQLDP